MRLAIICCTLALALTSCGGERALSEKVLESDDPWAALLEVPSPEEALAMTQEWQRAEQEATAACMRRNGFDYSFILPALEVSSFEASEALDEQFDAVSEYGFGITIPIKDGQMNSDDEAVPLDPNAAYVSSLAPDELVAYQIALYGEPLEEFGGVDSSDPNGSGCVHEAYKSILPPDFPSPGDWEALGNLRREIEEQSLKRPEMVNASADYEKCMSNLGFGGISHPAAVFADLAERWAEISSSEVAVERAQLEVAGSTELVEIQQYERSLALADLECIRSWNTVYDSVQRDVEIETMTENLELLNRLQGFVLLAR